MKEEEPITMKGFMDLAVKYKLENVKLKKECELYQGGLKRIFEGEEPASVAMDLATEMLSDPMFLKEMVDDVAREIRKERKADPDKEDSGPQEGLYCSNCAMGLRAGPGLRGPTFN